MKLLTSAALAASLCITSVTPAIAENIVGSVKAWQYMQADGWTSADGYDDNHMHNALYQAVVLDNYPWTNHFFLRSRDGGSLYLADKKSLTVRYIDIKPRDEYPLHLRIIYQGNNEGQGCYFAVVDDRMANYWTAVEDKLLYQYPAVENVDEKAAELKKQFTPEVMMMVKDNCVNKQQQAALAARRTEKDRELQQWVAQQSLAELCRRTGNC
ncbi:hypothetical protein FBH80_22500 [Escherichia coli]|nr:hypothetical protein [Escherichia coli]